MAPSQLGIFMKSDAMFDTPNIEFHVQPLSLEAFGQPLHDFPAITVSVCNLRPQSSGTVKIVSPDFDRHPEIAPNYLSTDSDRQVAADSIKAARRLMATRRMAQYRPEEFKPGTAIQSPEELARAAGDIATTIFHPVGTARMGPDGDGGAVWALGFRNPWKFTFAPGGELFLVDVGQDRWEEVNLVARGGNHGWPAREGAECHYLPDAPGLVEPDCPHLELVDPVVAYAHLALDPEGGQSVTGGVVVTDPGLPELLGRYVYGDFVTGRLWAYDPASGRVERLLDTGLPLTAVAAGEAGEVLLLGVNGVLARLERLP